MMGTLGKLGHLNFPDLVFISQLPTFTLFYVFAITLIAEDEVFLRLKSLGA
jgi:hypothetical protein